MLKPRIIAIAALAATAVPAIPATALDTGDWIFRGGVANVSPDVDSGTSPNIPGGMVDVSSGTSVTLNLGYMLTSNLALDILGAWPFAHDIEGAGALEGAGVVAEIEHLPPTIGVQYHFSPQASVRPYIGGGINYTTFTSIDEVGALKGDDLDLSDSVGLALQGGVDFDISDNWFLNFDVRWMQIETEADSATTGKFDVTLDPWVVGLAIGTTF
jgi:outer membrane protein